jgi:N-acetylglucosamine-6-sulfatase
MSCYTTSVIGNASLAWIERLHQQQPHNPFLALISVKAPHIQEGPSFPKSVPAPWYESTTIPEQKAPRTPNYNTHGSDHHWIVRTQTPLTKQQTQAVDELYVSRLKTMISVDDLVEALITQLENMQVLNNTYVIFTSDNGYRLGQFSMPMCKLHPYENDIRVPMMIRGPKITRNKNTTVHWMATHVDLMPTLLGLATHKYHSQDIVPSTMDGSNHAGKLVDDDDDGIDTPDSSQSSSSLLVEYISLGDVVRYQHLVDTYNHSFLALRIMDRGNDHVTHDNNNSPDDDDNNLSLYKNLKYIEFRDCRYDWNSTGPYLERELYDLDKDPYELNNIIEIAPSVLIQALQEKMRRMQRCKGASCREETAKGLSFSYNQRIQPSMRSSNSTVA